jgi:hypothetical protein
LQSRHGVTAFHLLEGLDGWRWRQMNCKVQCNLRASNS